MEAKDRFDLARVLRKEGYVLLSCKQKTGKKRFDLSLQIFGGIPIAEKIVFARNLGVMITAGLSISKALDILGRQTSNKKFSGILRSIMENVQKGNSLSESMKRYPGIFSGIFTAMARVGEESGQLGESLKTIANQMDRDYAIRKKVKGAMIYPAVIIIAMVLIGIMMMIYVVPTLVSTFEELGVEMPLSTRAVIFVSDLLVENTIFFVFSSLIAVALTFMFARSKKGKRIIETVSLKIPVVSPLVKKINSARTGRTLASLISSGVNVLEALDITKEVVQNSHYKEVIEKAKINIQKGNPISESFKKETDLYAVLFGEMIAVGEETGKLPEMLYRVAEFYEEEVSETTKNMAAIIEPFLMVLIGVVVGFFAISMIKPMYSMMSGI